MGIPDECPNAAAYHSIFNFFHFSNYYNSTGFLFLYATYNIAKPIIKITGNKPTLLSATSVPLFSRIRPITGRNIATETKPAPPSKDSPNAPLFGYVFRCKSKHCRPEIANAYCKKDSPYYCQTRGAYKTQDVDPCMRRILADINRTPTGFILWTSDPAKYLPTAIIPEIRARISMGLTPAFARRALTH